MSKSGVFFILFILFIPVIGLAAAPTSPYFNEKTASQFQAVNGQLLDVYYKDFPLGTVQAYEYKNGVMVPFGALAHLLGFSVTIDPKQGAASGWLLRESQQLLLSTRDGKIVVNGIEKKIPQHLVIASDMEIYSDSTFLGTLLPIKMTFDYTRKRLSIVPSAELSATDHDQLTVMWSQIIPKTAVASPRYNVQSKVAASDVQAAETAPQAETVTASEEDQAKTIAPTDKVITTQSSNELDEDHLVLLQPSLEGFAFKNLIESYSIKKRSYLPLGAVARLLELPIDTDPKSGKAEGWFINEKRQFLLDNNKRMVVIEGKSQPYPEGAVITNDSDIFVDSTVLSTWLPIDSEVNTNMLTLAIKPREILPIQSKQQRNASWEKNKAKDKTEKKYPELPVPYQPYAVPFVDVSVGHNYNTAATEGKNLFDYSVNSAGDLGYLTTQSFMSGDSKGLSNLRVMAGRKDSEAALLGPLHATAFSIGDIDVNPTPLAGLSGQGRGISITNRSLTAPTQFDVTEFVGNDLPGWQVELYRNGALLGLQQISTDGKYRFTDIPVLYGDNSFRLVFYGPQGQIREEVKHIVTNDTVLKKGESHYAFSADQKDQTVFGVGDDSNAQGLRMLSEVEYGVTNRLTVTAGALQVPLKDESHSYLTTGLISSLPGGILARSDIAYDIVTQGTAEQFTALTSLHNVSLKGEYRLFQNFISEELEIEGGLLKNSMELDADMPLPFLSGFSTGANIKRDIYEGGFTRTTMLSRLSGSVFGTSLTNNIGITEEDSIAGKSRFMTGSVAVNTTVKSVALRAAVNYTLPDKEISSFNLSAQKRIKDNIISVLSYTKDLSTDYRSVMSGSLNWDINYAKISFKVDVDSENALFVGTNIAFSLGREPHQGKWQAQGSSLSGVGAVSARAYLDKNYNGLYDDGDEWIKKAGVKIANRSFESDKNGIIFGSGLPPTVSTHVALDESSLKDSLWITEHPDYAIVSRPGAITTIDFPVIATSEIDGIVSLLKDGEKKSLSGIEVQLVNQKGEVTQSAFSEFDGFYLFSKVKPGVYLVRITPAILQKRQLTANSHAVTTTGESDIYSERAIVLQPLGAAVSEVTPPASGTVTITPVVSQTVIAVPVGKVTIHDMPKETPPIPPAKAPASKPIIQFGAFATRAAAEKLQAHLESNYKTIIGSLPITIEEVFITGKGTLYRVLIKGTSQKDNRGICDALIKKKQPCLTAGYGVK